MVLDGYKAYIRRSSSLTEGKTTRASDLTALLRASILRGDLKPGQKVNLAQLRVEYGVSLSPLREAISRLAVDGLVKIQDQRGSTIAPLSLSEIEEIGQLRREVDVLALRASMSRRKAVWFEKVRAAAVELHGISRDETAHDFEEKWSIAHTEFHEALICGCEMPMLIAFCMNLHDLQERYRRQLPLPSSSYLGEWRVHAEIASSVLAGDEATAVRALRSHFDSDITALAELLVDAP